MPDYTVIVKKSAAKSIRRLDTTAQDRLLSAIAGLAKEPRPQGCRKLVGSDDTYRIRIGDYRVVYAVDDEVLIVAVEKAGHRKDVYR